MLDLACIFTTGGVLLFCKTFCEIGLDVVNDFIFNVFVQEKLNEKQFKIKDRIFIWKFDSEIKVVFLFAYQELFKSFDFAEMLSYTKSYYKKNVWKDVVKKGDLVWFIPDFENNFNNLYKAFNKKALKDGAKPDMKQDAENRTHIPEGDGKKQSEPEDLGDNEGSDGEDAKEDEEKEKAGGKSSSILKDGTVKSEQTGGEQRRVAFREDVKDSKEEETSEPKQEPSQTPSKKLTPREIMEMKIKQKQEEKQRKKEANGEGNKVPGSGKNDRTWTYSDKITNKDMDRLDYSKKFNSGSQIIEEQTKNNSYFDNDEDLDLDFEIISDDEGKKESDKKTKKSGILSSFKNSFKSFTVEKTLSEADLKKVLEKFKDDLMTKNVAEEIARDITESLKIKLVNQKLQMFSSLTELVKTTLKETLTKIMTPKKTHDILAEASKAREKGETYVVSFIGVNGVGKSTNLAKVAYLFKSQGFSVMFAACDNFRAGAVEQLKTHGRALDIPVYDRGYKDEPHRIAREAIREARSKRIDVVLIDTAGRMQNNEPLMRALAKLVSANNPDLVVFIGEALVGNDGVDQLTNFNSALLKYSTEENSTREIDAILISKFDTVDEKGNIKLS